MGRPAERAVLLHRLAQAGRRIALYSSFAVVMLSFWSEIFARMSPITKDPFLGTIFGGVIIGIGVGIVIRSAMYSLVAYFVCSRMIDTVYDGLDSTKGVPLYF